MMELTQNQTQNQAGSQAYRPPAGFFKRLSVLDWLYAAALLAASLFALNRYGAYMDYYEQAILLLAAPTFTWLGWHWKPVRALIAGLAVLALFAVAQYGG